MSMHASNVLMVNRIWTFRSINMVTENIYYTYVKRKLKSFRNAKTLVNLYPKNKQENVKEFVDINNVNFKNSKEILKLLYQFSIK